MRPKTAFLFVLAVSAGSCAAGPATESTGDGAGGSDAAGGSAGSSGVSGSSGAPGSTGTAGRGGIDVVVEALSGTRLKAYWNGSADGAKQFAFKWYDSQLQIDCTFNTAVGVGRCLPADIVSGSPLYSDMTCATVVAAAVLPGTGCQTTTPTLVQVSLPDTTVCGGYATTIYNVGGSYTGGAFLKSGTNCISGGSLPQSGYLFYSLGAIADLSKYQAITLAHD